MQRASTYRRCALPICPSKVVNSFGVQDDFLYQYALPILNKRAEERQPFFTVLLSISNHPSYVIPDYFKPHSTKLEDQIVEYADWAIRQFMQEARKQPWFENTIFVLLGDHGKLVGSPYCEIPQSYNHVPGLDEGCYAVSFQLVGDILDVDAQIGELVHEIGRASCRERV